jgi:TolA-binding protein
MKSTGLLLALIFALSSAGWSQPAPTQAPATHQSQGDHQREVMNVRQQQIDEMKADVDKMRASLAQMKANLFTIRDQNELDRWRNNVELWEALVGHMDRMLQHMESMAPDTMSHGHGGPPKHPTQNRPK